MQLPGGFGDSAVLSCSRPAPVQRANDYHPSSPLPSPVRRNFFLVAQGNRSAAATLFCRLRGDRPEHQRLSTSLNGGDATSGLHRTDQQTGHCK